ncbi:phosphoribosyl-AMP cyclohydrolase [Henriciella algicola]|uniref:phosphoribosyl-AMP cyclohydrolase n=1 Tax=Henriciella algicola TaxID=1608422 RepID=UPI001F3CA6C6|nr:phosphoribosyl-AMP cyclohydrolase [Henriciella algicola]
MTMIKSIPKTALIAAPLAIAFPACAQTQAISSSASTASAAPITKADVAEAQQAWGEGIVTIGKAFSEGDDYTEAAEAHIERFYAYGSHPVLFKPTLAAEEQFRGDFDGALSYFVGGSIDEDNGFAIAPYTDVRWENEATFVDSDSAMAMGNYYFTRTSGEEVKVEYSFGYVRDNEGDLKIVLHHSSLPYAPE